MLAARVTGLGWRDSAVLGTLMNTRGLTELIVLNLALEKGVISEALFAVLVIMALVTTFMAGPLLKLLDPRNEFGAPVEEELEEARRESQADSPRSRSPSARSSSRRRPTAALAAAASRSREPLARSSRRARLILARLVRPPRGGVGARRAADRGVQAPARRPPRSRPCAASCCARGIAARSRRLHLGRRRQGPRARSPSDEEVDLLLLDGRRPLLGRGVPRGDVGVVLQQAPCDVAVLVAREGTVVEPGPGDAGRRPVRRRASTTGPRSSSAPGSRPPPARR